MVWKVQTSLPVRTSYPLTCPGGISRFLGVSWIDEPTITTLRQTTGGEATVKFPRLTCGPSPSVRSTFPPSPKLGSGLPVFASIEMRFASAPCA